MMKRDYGSVGTIALKADTLLQAMSRGTEEQRKEFNLIECHQMCIRNAVAKLPKLSRHIVELTVKEVEESGYEFNGKQAGNVEQYTLTIQNIIDIYIHRQISKYHDIHKGPYVISVINLKGEVSKTVSTVTLAYMLYVHQDLLRRDLHVLIIGLDPQISSTMFLDHTRSTDAVPKTAARAILNDLDVETLRGAVIRSTVTPGVDAIPASADGGFMVNQWESLVVEHLPGLKPSRIPRKITIGHIADDYDFVFTNTGPHLDPFLLSGLAASGLPLTPAPPAQADFHSTLKYLTRLLETLERFEEEGVEPRPSASAGFMPRMTSKRDHGTSHSLTRKVHASNILNSPPPRLDGLEWCGKSFDTIISANPVSCPGSAEAPEKARTEAERSAKAVFDCIEYIQGVSR